MNTITVKERWDGFDILKTLCAFLIVFIHAPFPGELGKYLLTLCRVAVPIFFMITGFFYEGTCRKNKEGKQIKGVVWMLVWSSLLYFGYWTWVKMKDGPEALEAYFDRIFDWQPWMEFLLFNKSVTAGHLWYLAALAYTLVIVGFFFRKKKQNLLYIAIPFLLLVDLMVGKYSIFLFGVEGSYLLVRNFLCMGIPYFSLGALMYEKREHLLDIRERKYPFVVYGMFLFALTSCMERFVLIGFKANASRDHYISSTILAVFLFLFFMNYKKRKELNKVEKILATIGRKYSTLIYILHPLVRGLLSIYLPENVKNAINYPYTRVFLIFVVSIFVAYIIDLIFTKISHVFHKKSTV